MHPQVLITPLCGPPQSYLELVGRSVQKTFGLSTCIKTLIHDIEFAYHFSRNQYHSTSILEALDQQALKDYSKILAIADVDLFIPILTHVFGEAQMGGRAAMISTYRLIDGLPQTDADTVFLNRVIKEALHELGHTFRLKHCPDPACIMHYCRSLKDVDHKSPSFCRYCRILLDEERPPEKNQPASPDCSNLCSSSES